MPRCANFELVQCLLFLTLHLGVNGYILPATANKNINLLEEPQTDDNAGDFSVPLNSNDYLAPEKAQEILNQARPYFEKQIQLQQFEPQEQSQQYGSQDQFQQTYFPNRESQTIRTEKNLISRKNIYNPVWFVDYAPVGPPRVTYRRSVRPIYQYIERSSGRRYAVVRENNGQLTKIADLTNFKGTFNPPATVQMRNRLIIRQ